jgi:hypothetical protein
LSRLIEKLLIDNYFTAKLQSMCRLIIFFFAFLEISQDKTGAIKQGVLPETINPNKCYHSRLGFIVINKSRAQPPP